MFKTNARERAGRVCKQRSRFGTRHRSPLKRGVAPTLAGMRRHASQVGCVAWKASFVAALSLWAGQSLAQSSVTIYGIVDGSFGETTDGGAHLKRLDSGVAAGNRLGFKGSEDLGDGLRANYLLEMGFAVDTGTLQQGGAAWGRQAYVGLGGQHWTLSVGRQYAPLLVGLVTADALGQGYWGNTIATGNGILMSPASVAGDGGQGATARISNSIQGTYTVGPLTGKLMVSAGDESSVGGGHFASPAVVYASGPLVATVAVSGFRQYAKDIPGATRAGWQHEALAGVSYDFGVLKASAGYYDFNPSEANKTIAAATLLETRSFWLGAKVPFGIQAITAQVMSTKYKYIGPAGKRTTLALAYEYNLSKRSRLYASYGQVSNNAAGRVPLTGSTTIVSPAFAGADPKALSFGMMHGF